MVRNATSVILGVALVLGGITPLSIRGAEKNPNADEHFLANVAKLPTDNASLLNLLREQCRLSQALTKVDELVRQLGDPNFAKREQAARDLKALGWPALPGLRAHFSNPDQEIAKRSRSCAESIEKTEEIDWVPAAVRLLVSRRAAGTLDALLKYLPHTRDPKVEEEIYWGADELIQEDARLVAPLRDRLQDSLPACRAVAGCILALRGDAKTRESVKALAHKEQDPYVRLRAAQGLLAARDAAGVPILIGLLSEESVAISWQAEELLHWAAEQTAPKDVVGNGQKESRERCQQAWQRWWQQHKDGFRFLPSELQPYGPGMLLTWHPPDTWGEEKSKTYIAVMGCDGLPRYELFLDGPVRFVGWMPEGAFLVAQRPVDSVEGSCEERTLLGTVRRQFSLEKVEPESWCRLPSGHLRFTGVGPSSEVQADYDEVGKLVRAKELTSPHPVFVAPFVGPRPSRLRNGHVIQPCYTLNRRNRICETSWSGDVVIWEGFAKRRVHQHCYDVIYPLVRFGFLYKGKDTPTLDCQEYRLRALRHVDPEVRLFSMQTLQTIPVDEQAFDAAFSAVGQRGTLNDLWTAKHALRVMARFPRRCEAILPQLVAIFGEDDLGVGGGFVAVLQAMDTDKVVPALIKSFLDRESANASKRRAGAIAHLEVLYMRSRPDVLEVVKQAFRDDDPKVRAKVAQCAEAYPDGKIAHSTMLVSELVYAALDDADQEVNANAFRALASLGRQADSAVPTLLQSLKNQPRQRLIPFVLIRVGLDHPEVVPSLMICLEDKEDPYLVAYAAEAIAERPGKSKAAVKALVKALQRPWEGEAGNEARSSLVNALGSIGSDAKESLPTLESLRSLPGQMPGWQERVNAAISRINAEAGIRGPQ